MKIHQIYADNALKNFTYIIELDNKSVFVIDPWDAKTIKKIILEKNLKIKAIINTHEHWDHIQGNQALVNFYQCEV